MQSATIWCGFYEIIKVCTDYKVCNLDKNEVEGALAELEEWQENFKDLNKINEVYNQAQILADKIPILVYSEHLTNLGRFTRNQIHETAKTLAITHEIPELNHHLMEGLEYPKENKEKIYFMFFESDLYNEKINKRIAVTKDVLDKQGIRYTSIKTEGDTKLGQILIDMLYAMYTAYTLGIIHEKDPSDIKWVNYFKDQLSK